MRQDWKREWEGKGEDGGKEWVTVVGWWERKRWGDLALACVAGEGQEKGEWGKIAASARKWICKIMKEKQIQKC